MIRKRTLFILIAFVLLLSNIPALAADVDVNEIDYKDFVRIVREDYRAKYGEIFDTPTPIFKAVINGKTYTATPYTTTYEDSMQIEPHITVPVGTEINLEDISIGGDGRDIISRDWQIYKRDADHKDYDRFTAHTKDKTQKVIADREGYIYVFLNVADDLKYEGYNNWSDRGNWRDGRTTGFSYKGNKVVGWYFTVLKIKVEEGKPDFEIRADNPLIEVEKDKQESIDIDFTVSLKDTDEEIETVVDFYKDNQFIESRTITVKGNDSINVSFTVPTSILKEGSNNFYGVVNADFDLKIARPFEDEIFLDNNKANVVVVLQPESPELELPPLPEPPNPIVTDTRSPNVAIKWDKIPLKINESSTLTPKLQRNSSSVTWNRYQIDVIQDFQGTIRGTSTIKKVEYSQDFMLKKDSSWFDLNIGDKPKYTVPSNGKPGTMLIAKLTVWSRLTDPFPGLPPAPQKPQPEVPKPSYPPPSPPSPPPHDAPDDAWSAYYSELAHYDSLMEPWRAYYAYINSPEYQEYLLRLADYNKLVSVRSVYNTLEDGNPELIPVEGYNFPEYAAYHDEYNSFIGDHLKRYVAIEDTPKALYWFRRQEVSSTAEAKNTIVHIPENPGKGGLDPGIIIPPKP